MAAPKAWLICPESAIDLNLVVKYGAGHRSKISTCAGGKMKIVASTLLILGLMFSASSLAFGQKFDVKIIDRKDNETDYTYVVPGYFSSNSNSYANCNGSDSNVNCSGSTTTNGYSTPAQQVSYHVRGATFALQLPDGRVAVVNCESKFKERFAGVNGNHRSCRQPLVDDVQADFHGDNAKLEWVVSLDGKKKQTETYKVLAVLDKAKSN
jgi:hypothetical protein